MPKGMYVGYKTTKSSPYSRASRTTRSSRGSKSVSFRSKSASRRKEVKSLKKEIRKLNKSSTLSKLKTEKVRPDGPISESHMVIPTWVKKTFTDKFNKHLLGKWTDTIINKAPLSWTQNNQSYTQVGYFTPADISSILTTVTATYVPNQAAVKNFKVLLDHCKADLLISNATSDVVAFKIYDVVARTNITNASYSDPASCWLQGATDQGLAANITTPGTNPFCTSAFTKLYKVVKVTDVWLHTGGHHCHQLKVSPQYAFDNEEKLNLGSTTQAYGGLTCFSMLVGHGFPVNETNSGGTIALSKGQVECVVVKNYDYRVLQVSNAPISFTISDLQSLTNQQMISDVTGATQVVTTA